MKFPSPAAAVAACGAFAGAGASAGEAALAGCGSVRCIASTRTSSESPLLRKSLTPSCLACFSNASDPHAVRIITAACGSIVRNCLSTSMPFISGMRRSSSVKRGRCFLNNSRPSRPFKAVMTSCPKRPSTDRSRSQTNRSSSTTRIVGTILSLLCYVRGAAWCGAAPQKGFPDPLTQHLPRERLADHGRTGLLEEPLQVRDVLFSGQHDGSPGQPRLHDHSPPGEFLACDVRQHGGHPQHIVPGPLQRPDRHQAG